MAVVALKKVQENRVLIKKGRKHLGFAQADVADRVMEGLRTKKEVKEKERRLSELAHEITAFCRDIEPPYNLVAENLGRVTVKLTPGKEPEIVVTDPIAVYLQMIETENFFDLFLPTEWKVVDVKRAMELLGEEFWKVCAPVGLEITSKGEEWLKSGQKAVEKVKPYIKEKPGKEASLKVEWHVNE